MPQSRQQVTRSASQKLNAALSTLASVKATVGFDGFVDEIISVVDKRHDFEHFERIKTIGAIAKKITDAAGQSSNYELIVKQMKLGGNGPIMANALAGSGMSVNYLGTLGHPAIHPVFEELRSRAHVVSIGEPGHTDALEFDDGKLMFGKITAMNEVTWENLVARVGLEAFKRMLIESQLIGFVNWTMLPHMNEIWSKMIELGLPNREGKQRIFFVDLADPEKRSAADIALCLAMLTRFQAQVDVVFGLNLKEAGEIAEVLHLPIQGDPEAAIETTARDIRERLGLSCVVVHPRRGAAAATADASASFSGPFVRQPMISTGAGDHFNAGFCLGRVLGMSLEESLCCGVGVSGYYVRNAASPTGKQLADFIAELPEPQ